MVAKWVLFFLLGAFRLQHEARAASVALAQGSEDSAPAAVEARDEFYENRGVRCKKCPPGYKVGEHCTQDAETTCHPCPNDTFVNHMNPLKVCFPCKTCRQLDEVELQPCTRTNDTKCACKTGTFCSPRLPCETCHKCQPRCPEGEQMVKPCTPTSDTECVPYTTFSTPPADSNGSITWIVVGSLLAFVLVLAAVVGFCYHTGARSRESVLRQLGCKWLCRNCSRIQREEADNMWNAQVDSRSLRSSQNYTDSTSRTPEMVPLQGAALPEEESHGFTAERERNLIPANGKDPIEALYQSFDTFITEVPVKEWWRYMRALGLTEHEIDRAKHNEKDLYEQQFQMLRTWLDRSGKKASLNTLLETLGKIELRGIEEKMRTSLISQGLYIYEE